MVKLHHPIVTGQYLQRGQNRTERGQKVVVEGKKMQRETGIGAGRKGRIKSSNAFKERKKI